MSFIRHFNRIKKQINSKIKEIKIDKKLNELKEDVLEIKDNVGEKISNIDEKYKISDKVKDVAEDVSEKVSEVKEKIEEKVESLTDRKIDFDDFKKIELKVGKILDAEKIKKSKKLLKLKVDFGDGDERQVVSGISEHYEPESLVGKKVIFVTNLIPRKIMGLESEAMILALSDEKTFTLLTPDKKRIKEGTSAS